MLLYLLIVTDKKSVLNLDSLENPVSLNLKHSEHLQLGEGTIDFRNSWNKDERVMETAAKEGLSILM